MCSNDLKKNKLWVTVIPPEDPVGIVRIKISLVWPGLIFKSRRRKEEGRERIRYQVQVRDVY